VGTHFDHVLDTTAHHLMKKNWWLIQRRAVDADESSEALEWRLKMVKRDGGIPGFVCWEEVREEKDILQRLRGCGALPEDKVIGSLLEAVAGAWLLAVASCTTARYSNGLYELDFSTGVAALPVDRLSADEVERPLLFRKRYVLATVCHNVQWNVDNSAAPEDILDGLSVKDCEPTFGNTLMHVWLQSPPIATKVLDVDPSGRSSDVHWCSDTNYRLYEQFIDAALPRSADRKDS
jgi:hypothetical protein